MQRFHAAKVFFRRFAVAPYTLGGNEDVYKRQAFDTLEKILDLQGFFSP